MVWPDWSILAPQVAVMQELLLASIAFMAVIIYDALTYVSSLAARCLKKIKKNNWRTICSQQVLIMTIRMFWLCGSGQGSFAIYEDESGQVFSNQT